MKNEMNFLQVLQANKNLAGNVYKKNVSVEVLSNITLNNISDVLEYFLRVNDIQPQIFIGGYDTILPESFFIKDNNASVTIIFWEAANLTEHLHYKIESWSENEIEMLINEKCKEIELLLYNLQQKKLVLFNKFSSLLFTTNELLESKFDRLCNRLNDYLLKIQASNLLVVDITKIIAETSVSAAYNRRQFHTSKSLYTPAFIINYIQYIIPSILSVNGSVKKALILDCDNTLWKGILGEDGLDNVKMTSEDGGYYFEEVQHIIVSLAKKGVIICLCSKNNITDVDEIFLKRMKVLTYEHIVLKKINWESKVSNIESLAQELNIGLDSMVFVDDSNFEINLIKELLPQVNTYLVPEDSSLYPETMREVAKEFFKLQYTSEDSQRIKMYQVEAERNNERNAFGDISQYIDSLDLEVLVYKNCYEHFDRIVQLCQKTNQFNISTKRYTETEIKEFLNLQNKYTVYTFAVKDKFGEYGIVGLAIVLFSDLKTAFLDTWLMSCRVMGRNIEYAFFDYIVKKLEEQNIVGVHTVYSKTKKNIPVSGIFEILGFSLDASLSSDTDMYYQLNITTYSNTNRNKIKIYYYEQ
jgi:FkbH-like protein